MARERNQSLGARAIDSRACLLPGAAEGAVFDAEAALQGDISIVERGAPRVFSTRFAARVPPGRLHKR